MKVYTLKNILNFGLEKKIGTNNLFQLIYSHFENIFSFQKLVIMAFQAMKLKPE